MGRYGSVEVSPQLCTSDYAFVLASDKMSPSLSYQKSVLISTALNYIVFTKSPTDVLQQVLQQVRRS